MAERDPLTDQALHKLLDAFDRSERRDSDSVVLPFTRGRFPAYLQLRNAQRRRRLAEELTELDARGVISVEWEPRQEGVQIARLRLREPQALAEALGRELLGAQVDRLQDVCAAAAAEAPDWLRRWWEEALARWRAGKKPLNAAPHEASALAQLLRLVGALEREGARGLDMRTLSARWLGDSKAIERLAPRLAALYREHWGEGLREQEVLERLGLAKFPLPTGCGSTGCSSRSCHRRPAASTGATSTPAGRASSNTCRARAPARSRPI